MKNLLLALSLLTVLTVGFQNSGHVAGTDLTLYWTFLNTTHVDIAFEWQRESFVVLLIGSNMNQKDLWLCSMQPGSTSWVVSDRWSPFPSPPKNDSAFNGTDDFINPTASYDGQKLSCKFRRKLDTGDHTDSVLKKGQTYKICSINSTTKNLVKHNGNIYCFYWKFINGFNGELEANDDLEGTNWALIHGIVMSAGWGVLVDFGIMAARYFKTKRLYTIYHAIMMSLISFTSLPMAVYMVVLHRRNLFYNFDLLQTKTVIHFILGSVLVGVILIVYIIGIITRTLQQNPTKPVGKFLTLRKIHEYLARSVYVLTKGQVILGWWIYEGGFELIVGLFFGWYALIWLFMLTLEVSYRRHILFFRRNFRQEQEQSHNEIIQSLIQDNDNEDIIAMVNAGKSYESIRQAHPTVKFVHFKNRICDVTKFNHPGGTSLLNQVLGRDVSKYIFGGAAMEGNTQVTHKHSEYAIGYLEKHVIGTKPNIAKIERQQWDTRESQEISPNLFKFLIKNRDFSIDTNPRQPNSYLGKFWLVTTASGTTRPYTAVLSQLPCNVLFRARLLQAAQSKFTTPFALQTQPKSDELPLMIKRYDRGAVSREVHDGFVSIEGLFGVGLLVQPGNNVIIAGGTGLLPFLDLFDLVLKKAVTILADQSAINSDIFDPYKVGYKTLFPGSRFTLFVSFTSGQQFANYSWLRDLHQLSAANKLGLFELWVKLPNIGTDTNHYWFSNSIDEVFFETHIKMDARIYICGPPRMNDELLAVTQRLGYAESAVVVL